MCTWFQKDPIIFYITVDVISVGASRLPCSQILLAYSSSHTGLASDIVTSRITDPTVSLERSLLIWTLNIEMFKSTINIALNPRLSGCNFCKERSAQAGAEAFGFVDVYVWHLTFSTTWDVSAGRNPPGSFKTGASQQEDNTQMNWRIFLCNS